MIPLGDDNTGRVRTPYVTYALIVINVLVFFLELGQGSEAQLQAFFEKWSVVPREYASQTDLPPEIPFPFWFTLFSSMFMHGGWMHLIGNMLYLWIFGDNIEDRWGHAKFLIIYLICGVIASFAHIFFNANSTIPSLGASGAISGVLGAYLVMFPRNRIRVLVMRMITTVPAIVVLGFWIVLQFINQIGQIGSSAETAGVAYWAHIGGFLAGVLFAFVLRGGGRQPSYGLR
jgi:membrane associated rhomboid family serine protease